MPIADYRCQLSTYVSAREQTHSASRCILKNHRPQVVKALGDTETACTPASMHRVPPCASSNPFRIYTTSYIQRARSAARRCGSLELRRMDLVGSSAPLSARLAKTKRLMSSGETAHDNAKGAAEGHSIQHHSGANIALRCSDNGFKSRLALRLIKVKVLVGVTK